MSDLLALLDQLEEARAKASKIPWHLVGGTHDREIVDDHGCHTATTGTFPDAALIVAVVNAAPKLTAALRAVERAMETAPVMRFDNDYPVKAVPVAELLSVFAAALTPEQVQP